MNHLEAWKHSASIRLIILERKSKGKNAPHVPNAAMAAAMMLATTKALAKPRPKVTAPKILIDTSGFRESNRIMSMGYIDFTAHA